MKIFLEVDRGMKIIGVFWGGGGGGKENCYIYHARVCYHENWIAVHIISLLSFLTPPPKQQQQQKINNVSLSR